MTTKENIACQDIIMMLIRSEYPDMHQEEFFTFTDKLNFNAFLSFYEKSKDEYIIGLKYQLKNGINLKLVNYAI